MTRLRKMMLEELQRRNFSEHTRRYYIRTVEDFAMNPSRLVPTNTESFIQVSLISGSGSA